MWNPPDPDSYFPLVWLIARQIPEGYVMTYGQIAAMIPPPDDVEPPQYDRLGARWVGQAMNNTPKGEGIPWQRVINSKGGISVPGASAQQQRALLESEGVEFNEKDLIDFNRFGWDGPDCSWLKDHNLYKPHSMKKPPGSTKQMTLL